MNELTESLDDIEEELRATAEKGQCLCVGEEFADRIAAAQEREVKEWNALRVKVADFENTKARLAKLKDIVKRLLPIIENGYDEAKAYGKAVKALCVLKDVDPGEVDKVLKGWEDLIHEAKEVAE